MFTPSIQELGLVLVIALIVFGPGKLPEVGKSLGRGLGELRRNINTDPKQEQPIAANIDADANKDK